MKNLKRYFTVWWLMSRNSFMSVLYQKLSFAILLLGKTLRFVFFIIFLSLLVRGTKVVAGYTLEQTMFFFLTFNLVDIVSQFFFREVYRFRPLIVSGDFDLILVKPVNALFRVLMGGADLIDLVTIPPIMIALYIVGRSLAPTVGSVIIFLALILCGLLISTAFHIFVLSFGILTFEIDHMIMIYRDLLSMGRFPVDIYREPIRSILTYLVPVGIMITFPAKALMGLVSPISVMVALTIGMILFVGSLKFWNHALKRYTSASS
jgi:ABC-2 type transport system permease protein